MGEVSQEADFSMGFNMQLWKDAQRFFQLLFTLKFERICKLKGWYILR